METQLLKMDLAPRLTNLYTILKLVRKLCEEWRIKHLSRWISTLAANFYAGLSEPCLSHFNAAECLWVSQSFRWLFRSSLVPDNHTLQQRNCLFPISRGKARYQKHKCITNRAQHYEYSSLCIFPFIKPDYYLECLDNKSCDSNWRYKIISETKSTWWTMEQNWRLTHSMTINSKGKEFVELPNSGF